jgi:hypothetical protein
MKQIIRKNILFIFLLSYVAVGVLGHTSIITKICPRTRVHKITRIKADARATSKLYWTQHKHIPPNIKISVPAPELVKMPELPRLLVYEILTSQDVFDIKAAPYISLYSSRAPPRV